MGISDLCITRHLSLDNLAVNPRLARRLPPALAHRYHALPVAEDCGRITVAMADPDDAAARKAIMAALDTTCCVVRSDPTTIDALLEKVWPEEAQRPLHLLACVEAGPIADEVKGYAQAIGNLLHAHVSYLPTTGDASESLNALAEETGHVGYDLIILGESGQSLVERLLLGSTDRRAVDQIPDLLLVARCPRWPLRRILLVIRDEKADDVAVDWVVRLARPCDAAVTILTVVPPVPAMCHGLAGMDQGLAALLAGDSALGRQMRRAAQRLVDWEIKSTLRLRQGPPDWLIHREVAEGDYDLVALAVEHHHRWLHWADRPVLVARSTTA